MAGGQADFVHEALIALVGLSLDAQEDTTYVLNALWSQALVQEGCSKYLEDQGSTTRLLADDVVESLFIKEQRAQDVVASFRFVPLVDDLEHRQVCDLVSAKMY